MIRCAWCGAENYAIDSWCASCSRHLDWSPPKKVATAAVAPPPAPLADVTPEPRHRPRRRGFIILAPAAAVLGLAIVLAGPVAIRLGVTGRSELPTLPNTAMRPPAQTQATPTPEVTPAAQPTPTPDATSSGGDSAAQPIIPAQPAPPAEPARPAAGDPVAAVAGFYQDVSAHDFAAATALWSSRMQARFPPSVYINHRFADTQQINLRAASIAGNRDGQAIVNVRVVELIGGQTRQWVGTWQLVNTASGWLLNQPNLRADS